MNRNFHTAYGIDASENHLVIVRASGRDSCETLANYSAPQVPALIKSRIEEDVASGRAVTAAAMACHETVLRRLTAPFSRLDRALKVLPSLLDVQLPFPLEECVHVFTGTQPAKSGGLNVVAVAARREDIQQIIQRIASSCDLDPMALDHEGLALWAQAAREIGPPGPVGRILIHLGPSHTTLVYGTQEGIRGAHSARSFGTSATSAALISRCQTWLGAQTAIAETRSAEWIFTGAEAANAERISTFQAQFGFVKHLIVNDPSTFLARGLAQRALSEDSLSCNLRAGELQHPFAARAAATGRKKVSLMSFAAGVLLIAINIGALWFASHRNERTLGEVQKLALEIANTPAPKGQETLVVRRALDDRAAKLAPFQKMIEPVASRSVADLLALCRTNGASVSRFELKLDSFHMEYTAAHAAGSTAIDRSLRSAGWKLQTKKLGELFVLEGSR